MEEFPHLHLSLHTWHELWRKGLTQIEQMTRSHQEARRKKSLAQNQVGASGGFLVLDVFYTDVSWTSIYLLTLIYAERLVDLWMNIQ